MKTPPSARAWEDDPFWKEVVSVITAGKKLRPDHYLDKLDAAELESLRLALSCSGTFAEQQKLCPKRRGGPRDGELPNISTLSEISEAMRQVHVLRGLEAREMISAAAKKRAVELGLDASLTNAVVQIVGEEALKQQAAGEVGNFAVNAAYVLMNRDSAATKAQLEKQKLEIKRQQLAQEDRRLVLLEKKAAAYDRLKDLREKKDTLTDSDRQAVLDHVDQILGIKK